jgi:hypothetical protein
MLLALLASPAVGSILAIDLSSFFTRVSFPRIGKKASLFQFPNGERVFPHSVAWNGGDAADPAVLSDWGAGLPADFPNASRFPCFRVPSDSEAPHSQFEAAAWLLSVLPPLTPFDAVKAVVPGTVPLRARARLAHIFRSIGVKSVYITTIKTVLIQTFFSTFSGSLTEPGSAILIAPIMDETDLIVVRWDERAVVVQSESIALPLGSDAMRAIDARPLWSVLDDPTVIPSNVSRLVFVGPERGEMMERFNRTIEELRDEFLFVRPAPLPESKIVLGNEFTFASGEPDDVWLRKPSSIARGGPGVCSAPLRIPKEGTADFTMDGVVYRLAFDFVVRDLLGLAPRADMEVQVIACRSVFLDCTDLMWAEVRLNGTWVPVKAKQSLVLLANPLSESLRGMIARAIERRVDGVAYAKKIKRMVREDKDFEAVSTPEERAAILKDLAALSASDHRKKYGATMKQYGEEKKRRTWVHSLEEIVELLQAQINSVAGCPEGVNVYRTWCEARALFDQGNISRVPVEELKGLVEKLREEVETWNLFITREIDKGNEREDEESDSRELWELTSDESEEKFSRY